MTAFAKSRRNVLVSVGSVIKRGSNGGRVISAISALTAQALGELPAKMSVHNKLKVTELCKSVIWAIALSPHQFVTVDPDQLSLYYRRPTQSASAVFESRANRLSPPDWILNNLVQFRSSYSDPNHNKTIYS